MSYLVSASASGGLSAKSFEKALLQDFVKGPFCIAATGVFFDYFLLESYLCTELMSSKKRLLSKTKKKSCAPNFFASVFKQLPGRVT